MERGQIKKIVSEIPGATSAGEFVFLCDPHWTAAQLDAARALIQNASHASAESGWLCITSGGTSGSLRFARHDEVTLSAAVSAFALHFGTDQVNAVGVLPMHHVSGLMARLRCEGTGGTYLAVDWKSLSSGQWPDLKGKGAWFISLVPTQLQRLLQLPQGTDFLRQFHAVMLGGGPTWSALADEAAAKRIPVAMSYGMTETAAMVCSQVPEDFAKGARDVGRPLPHAKITVLDEATKKICGVGVAGQIEIQADSVMRGYFPHLRWHGPILTEDLGELTESGALRVMGRRDAAIISGGKKIWPETVEAALHATGQFRDVVVIGMPDVEWGQVVVACYPASEGATVDEAMVKHLIGNSLPAYQHPKRYVAVATWPRNEQGKVSRVKLREML